MASLRHVGPMPAAPGLQPQALPDTGPLSRRNLVRSSPPTPKTDPAKYKLVSYPIENPLNDGGDLRLIHILVPYTVVELIRALAPRHQDLQ